MQNPWNPPNTTFLSGYALATMQRQPKQVIELRAMLGLDPKRSKGKFQNFKMDTMSIVALHARIQCSQRFKNVKNITYLRFCLPWPWFICDLMVVHHVLQAILIWLIVFLMWIIMNIGLFLFFSEQCWNVGWPSNVFDWGIWQSKSCSSVLQDGFAADSILNVCLFTRWSKVLDSPVLACQSKDWGFKFNDSNNLIQISALRVPLENSANNRPWYTDCRGQENGVALHTHGSLGACLRDCSLLFLFKSCVYLLMAHYTYRSEFSDSWV